MDPGALQLLHLQRLLDVPLGVKPRAVGVVDVLAVDVERDRDAVGLVHDAVDVLG